MCQRTYVSCGSCYQPVTEMRRIETHYYSEEHRYELDEDGDPIGDPDYGDPDHSHDGDSHYECPECGIVSSLDRECTPEDCECPECMEPDPAYEGDDPSQVVSLVRTTDYRVAVEAHTPREIATLYQDLGLHRLPIRRERAAEIYNEILDTGAYPNIKVDLVTEVSEDLVNELLIPHEEQELSDGTD